MALYAAYGSNMDPAHMLQRCPSSPVAGTGWLPGWRLTFGGEDIGWDGALATVVEDPDSSVFVVLYDMADSDERSLDSWEGTDLGLYSKIRLRVHTLEQRGETLLALDVGNLADVLAPVDQQVEGVECEVRAALVLERRLEQLKARPALLIERDRLAIDQATRGQLRRSSDQRLELVAPVEPLAGEGGRHPVANGEQQPRESL